MTAMTKLKGLATAAGFAAVADGGRRNVCALPKT